MAQETINQMGRQSSEWEKILEKLTSDKGLILKISKELTQLNNMKTDRQLRNGQKI